MYPSFGAAELVAIKTEQVLSLIQSLLFTLFNLYTLPPSSVHTSLSDAFYRTLFIYSLSFWKSYENHLQYLC